MLIVMIAIPAKALLRNKDKEEFYFILMLICMTFVKLCYSGSYLSEPYLYFLLGVSISKIRNKSLKE